MKSPWKILCLSGYLIFLSFASVAQCGTLQSITYDTIVAGNGNNTHVFSLSKFDPSVGTLVSARINSVISVNYGFTLQNVEDVQRDFSVGVGRYDNFSSAALSSPYTNIMNIPLGSFPLDPGNTVSRASTTVLSRFVQSDSLIYDMANFLGSGTIDYNYKPITYTNLTGSNVYYYSATASDTIHFSITYFYCTATVLPINIINFFAKKIDQQNIQLSWETLNELAGRNYEIQKSRDGNTFSTVGSEVSVVADNNTGNYLFDYPINESDNNKIYFRIKMTNISGAVTYSETREVDLDNTPGNISLYPNPSDDFINVNFNQPQTANLDIAIYSSNGILIQNNYYNANTVHISFMKKLVAGIYFMRIVNRQTQKNYVKEFTVK